MVCEEELSDPRNLGDRSGPDRSPSYGHQFGPLHDSVVGDTSPDETFFTKVSNKAKVDYIVQALRLDPKAFHLDLPFPLEDWTMSDDMSLINAGLYFADLRRQFFARLLAEQPDLQTSDAWAIHADAEYWNHTFNTLLVKRRQGILIGDSRVLH